MAKAQACSAKGARVKMLNEFLYNALKIAFGYVKVENEGMQAEIERFNTGWHTTEWTLKRGGVHGEQYRVDCPYCRGVHDEPDTKQHLYISYVSYMRPVVNGETLAVGRLYAQCFRGNCMESPANRSDLERRIMQGMACLGGDIPVSTVLCGASDNQQQEPMYGVSQEVTLEGIRTWAPDFKFVDDDCDRDIVEYLSGRGITRSMCEDFKIGWGQVITPRTGRVLSDGAPWVIVPVIVNGELRGVQARCPDKFLKEGGIKYWNHPSMRKASVVYNIDSARELGLAVVCEGVFDVFKVGKPGVCIFGHTPSSMQLTYLTGVDKGLIWLPDTDPHKDFDTVKDAQQLVAKMNADGMFPYGAHAVRLSGKDAGEMTRQQIWTEIACAVPDEMREFIINKIIRRL